MGKCIASSSQRDQIAILSFVNGLCKSIRSFYGTSQVKEEKDQLVQYELLLIDLEKDAVAASFACAPKINEEDAKRIKKRIEEFRAKGFENANSYLIYTSTLIGLISQMLDKFSSKTSKKYLAVEKVFHELENLHELFKAIDGIDEQEEELRGAESLNAIEAWEETK